MSARNGKAFLIALTIGWRCLPVNFRDLRYLNTRFAGDSEV
jgi:hypothetical protein